LHSEIPALAYGLQGIHTDPRRQNLNLQAQLASARTWRDLQDLLSR